MPAGKQMRTRWQPSQPCPLPEYPRPQMARLEWTNLNGWWEYTILPRGADAPGAYTGQILVPYAVESLLSGVQQALLPDQRLWYHRTFARPADLSGEERLLLHFGAVDYQCEVWVNGTLAGTHTGGYLPFSLDITGVTREQENDLVVVVCDPGDQGLQQRGKQVLQPKGIWYTPVSGIWQTVWLEVVPATHIESLKLTPDLDQRCVSIIVTLQSDATGDLVVEAWASSAGVTVAQSSGQANEPLTLNIPDPMLWSPASPHLYDLTVRIIRHGQVLDEVSSYFAMRKFSLLRDAGGCLRFALNNEPLFLYGPLDQGYFPDGLYTPPSEEAMLFDIEYIRQLGCNMIRKHIKVEPLRWYYHCDRLGLIVWQDMPNGGLIDGEVVAALSLIFGFHRNDTRRLTRFGRADPANRAEFRDELRGMIRHLHNQPCIAVWVPFNESWGQFQASEIARWVKAEDPTRLVDHASGWFDQGGGDFQSKHIYFKKLKRPRPDRRVFAISEFGGYSLSIAGHVWDEDKKFGYRFYDSPTALTAAYLSLLEQEVKPLISQGLAAAIYTQTTDVEIEINGYLTYDRAVEKMDARAVRAAHEALIETLRPG